MRRGWRTREVLKADEIEVNDIPDSQPSVLSELVSREEFGRILNALEQFADPQRQILLLRFVEMFKLEQIAKVMEMPVNTVKSHIRRGRKRLIIILKLPYTEKHSHSDNLLR